MKFIKDNLLYVAALIGILAIAFFSSRVSDTEITDQTPETYEEVVEKKEDCVINFDQFKTYHNIVEDYASIYYSEEEWDTLHFKKKKLIIQALGREIRAALNAMTDVVYLDKGYVEDINRDSLNNDCYQIKVVQQIIKTK